jgi:hypothetical protein
MVSVSSQYRAAEGAKKEAVTARDEAIQQKAIAERSQLAEVDARKQVELQRQKLAVFEYGGAMRVAHQEWRDGNLVAMRALLDGTDAKLRNWEWHFLNRLCDPSLLTLKGHTNSVSAASFSADGTRIVTASDDKTVKVWDAKTGAELLTLKGHTKGVTAASFCADGTRILTASEDGTAKIWDSRPFGK